MYLFWLVEIFLLGRTTSLCESHLAFPFLKEWLWLWLNLMNWRVEFSEWLQTKDKEIGVLSFFCSDQRQKVTTKKKKRLDMYNIFQNCWHELLWLMHNKSIVRCEHMRKWLYLWKICEKFYVSNTPQKVIVFHDCNFYIFMWHPSLSNAFLLFHNVGGGMCPQVLHNSYS